MKCCLTSEADRTSDATARRNTSPARPTLVCLALILLSGSAWCFTNEITGYASPKTDLLVPDSRKGEFKQLEIDRHYQLVKQIATGYLILWETTEGTPRLALVPFHDKFSNPTAHPYEPPITLINIAGITARPGFIPFKAGDSYPVVAQTNGSYSVIFSYRTLTQTVAVAETNFTYISLADYTGVIQSLVAAAKSRLATGASPDYVAATYTDYHGNFSAETAKARQELGKKYFERAARARYAAENEPEREPVPAEPPPNGLVKYQGKWVPKLEAEQLQKEVQQFEAEQTANGLVKYQGEWIPKLDAEQLQKGLVKFHDDWVTPAEKEKRLAEEKQKPAEAVK